MNGRWRVAAGAVRVASIGVAAIVVLALVVPAARADDHQVVIRDTGFDPPTLTVRIGEPVTWTNESSQAVALITDDDTLSSGQVEPGATFAHVFDAPGNVTYYVGGNPRLRATITVQSAADAVPPPSGANSPALLLAVAIVGAIAVGAALAVLVAASRRPGR